MRTDVQESSVMAYHGIVQTFERTQEDSIIDFISKNGEATIGEIAAALHMEKSTVSARQNKLRKDGMLVWGCPRKCNRSGILCKPVKMPARQLGLFQ